LPLVSFDLEIALEEFVFETGGIPLSLCKRIGTLHGGRIWAENYGCGDMDKMRTAEARKHDPRPVGERNSQVGDLLEPILALRAEPPQVKNNVIVASNIGRIGKSADEDDMNAITSGEAKLEFNETGDRYEIELMMANHGAAPDAKQVNGGGNRLEMELAPKNPRSNALFEAARIN
jgi:hypothetical protein